MIKKHNYNLSIGLITSLIGMITTESLVGAIIVAILLVLLVAIISH